MVKLQGLSSDRETDIAGNCPVKYEVIMHVQDVAIFELFIVFNIG